MLKRQHRVLLQHPLSRGDELLHPSDETVQGVAQVCQERDHLGALPTTKGTTCIYLTGGAHPHPFGLNRVARSGSVMTA